MWRSHRPTPTLVGWESAGVHSMLKGSKSSALTMSMKPDWLKYESAHIILFPFLWWFLDTTSLLSSKSHPPQSLILDFFKIGLLYYMWYFMK